MNLGGSFDFGKILQKMINEEQTRTKVNLYDAFKTHFIEEKAQLTSLLRRRHKIFKNEFHTFIELEQMTLEPQPTESTPDTGQTTNKKNLNVITTTLSDFLGQSDKDKLPNPEKEADPDSQMQPEDTEPPLKAYLVSQLHQFLENKETMFGYTVVKFDVLVNRWTFEWTLLGFFQGKEKDADDIPAIMHSFCLLNENENPLGLNKFIETLKGEQTKSKISGIKSDISESGWNINYFDPITTKPGWDFSEGAIRQCTKKELQPARRVASTLFQSQSPRPGRPKVVTVDRTVPALLFNIHELENNSLMIERIEALMKLYIETVSNINYHDKGWNLILAFSPRGQLIGFLSYFKFKINFCNWKIRVSQVFVLPDFQKRGVASQMLIGLYSLYWHLPEQIPKKSSQLLEQLIAQDFETDPEVDFGVKEIGVESPSPVFLIVYTRFLMKNVPSRVFSTVQSEIFKCVTREGTFWGC